MTLLSSCSVLAIDLPAPHEDVSLTGTSLMISYTAIVGYSLILSLLHISP